ncbi:3'(2'),5'-bisphosphate nucleotidase CysQ [Rhodobacteraceae bacterium]|nr:3'(2'),5'-bisphosphate nucleotidase CysQ [Paracoccaceae bacterium]
MPASDLAVLEETAREAGDIARSFWREDPRVWDKGGDDPVSEADFAVDKHLKERLLTERPDYGWVSEETEDDPARLKASRVFIVDPIDGTRSFVAGDKTWAHSLAVAEEGRITAACVFLPLRDKMYLAEEGKGATLNGEPIAANQNTQIEGATVLSPKVNFKPEFWEGTPPTLERHFRPSLAYRLALVAEGRFDAMMTFHPAWEWDIAAGALIAEEAGARVMDRHGSPLTFNSPARQTAGVITAGQSLAEALQRRLKR